MEGGALRLSEDFWALEAGYKGWALTLQECWELVQ